MVKVLKHQTMSKKYSIFCYIASAILLLLFVITLASCGSLRHYKKVAKDAPRNEAKRNLLAPICALEFPVKNKVDSIVVTEYKADTANELKLKLIIKQLAKQLEQRPECPQIDADSLYDAVKNSIKPDTLKITTKVKERIFDSAAFKVLQLQTDKYMQVAQSRFETSENELAQVKKERDQLKAGTKNNIQLIKWFLKNNWYWLLIIAGLFLGYKWLDSKFTLPFKFGK